MKLEPILGNSKIEKILFALETYGQAYPLELLKMFDIPVNGIQQQMDRLENGEVVISSMIGKTRLYQFNSRYPFLIELKALIQKAMYLLSKNEFQKYFRKRTRPKKKGKPL